MATWIATETFKLEERWTCARCSEKAADRDVRIPVKRPGAGLMYVPCTIYGRHERRRSRTRQDAFELKQREYSSAPRIAVVAQCSVAALRSCVWPPHERSGCDWKDSKRGQVSCKRKFCGVARVTSSRMRSRAGACLGSKLWVKNRVLRCARAGEFQTSRLRREHGGVVARA